MMIFATRQQLQTIFELGSTRNALKVLSEMKEYLHIQTHNGMNVYYLNKQGRELIGLEKEVKWNTQVDHHLMRNDLYIYFGCPATWQPEKKVNFMPEGLSNRPLSITPDVTFQAQENKFRFVEVDRTQSMVENKNKIENYKLLAPVIKKQFDYNPVIIFYTISSFRKQKLTQLCKAAGIEYEIITKEDIF